MLDGDNPELKAENNSDHKIVIIISIFSLIVAFFSYDFIDNFLNSIFSAIPTDLVIIITSIIALLISGYLILQIVHNIHLFQQKKFSFSVLVKKIITQTILLIFLSSSIFFLLLPSNLVRYYVLFLRLILNFAKCNFQFIVILR
jgi:hypothetical protein